MPSRKSEHNKIEYPKSEGIEANKIARTANNISRSAVIVNGLILLVTAGIASVAIWQYKSANSAAQTALKTFKADSINNDRVYKLQQAANKSADDIAKKKEKLDSQTFELQKSGLQAQIKALKETQAEFNNTHEPYLEIRHLNELKVIEGENIEFTYEVFNVGKSPIKEMFGGEKLVYVLKSDSIRFFENPFKGLNSYEPVFNYIADENKIDAVFSDTEKVPIGFTQKWVNGNVLLYFVGKRFYKNLITKKKGRYEYVIQLNFTKGQYTFGTVINNNYTYK